MDEHKILAAIYGTKTRKDGRAFITLECDPSQLPKVAIVSLCPETLFEVTFKQAE
jgi:hypothetical protein